MAAHPVQRADIQWLRAVAVGSVLIYHFWPQRLPGGFVGVDIFFVISGFLITSHLLAKPPNSWSAIVEFWGRRVRRLLPAAFLVILATVAGVALVLPMTQWSANGQSAVASGLYVENWNLALTSVDYLAQDDAPTALQHYWSLSVEEQFYFLWPLLFAAGLWLSSKTSQARQRTVLAGIVVTVFATSFLWSVYFTSVEPARAYFETPTRMWELALGGCAALVYPRVSAWIAGKAVLQVSLVGLGVVAMIATTFLLTTAQPFPGWIAMIPVAGAALAILAGPADYRFSFDRLLKRRPFQFIGDSSYSIYLWHWPLVVLLPVALGHPMNWVEKLAAIVVVVGLSWLSRVFVEERFRGERPLGKPLRRTFVFLIVGMVLTSAAGIGLSAYAAWQRDQQAATAQQELDNATCLGAAALLDPTCRSGPPHGAKLLISPLDAAADRNDAYADDCWWSSGDPQRFPNCEYGSASDSAPEIALLGNSHAGPWLTPLQGIAHEEGYRIRTYLASECYPSPVPVKFDNQAQTDGCSEFTRRAVEDIIQRRTALVVWTARTASRPLVDAPASDDGGFLERTQNKLLGELTDAGIRVLVVRDVPMPPDTVTDCVAKHAEDLAVCDGPRSQRILPDPLFDVAQNQHNRRVSTVDLTAGMCDEEVCYDVLGGLIVYFNRGHLTATFADTLRPQLRQAVDRALS